MIAFIDLETTGLDPEKDKILEVACVIVNDELRDVKGGRFHQVTSEAAKVPFCEMALVVQKMHYASGLWYESARTVDDDYARAVLNKADLIASDTLMVAVSRQIDRVDMALANHIRAVCAPVKPGDPYRAPELGGSSVHFDRAFIAVHLPHTHAALYRRNVDVSSIGEMVRRAWPAVWEARPRAAQAAHRAQIDIQHSIDLMRYYTRALGPVDARIDSTDS